MFSMFFTVFNIFALPQYSYFCPPRCIRVPYFAMFSFRMGVPHPESRELPGLLGRSPVRDADAAPAAAGAGPALLPADARHPGPRGGAPVQRHHPGVHHLRGHPDPGGWCSLPPSPRCEKHILWGNPKCTEGSGASICMADEPVQRPRSQLGGSGE